MLLSFLKKGMIDYFVAKSFDLSAKYNPIMDECCVEVKNLNKRYIKFSPTSNWNVFGKLVEDIKPNFIYSKKNKSYCCNISQFGETDRYMSCDGDTILVAFCKTLLLCKFGTHVGHIPSIDIVHYDLKKIENNEKN
jgi:hypothetical protein